MKILHICLEQPYLDGWTYQENILPSCHAELGNDVTVIASKNAFPYYVENKNGSIYSTKPSKYWIGKVKIIRIRRRISLLNRLDIYPELFDTIREEKPDLIFLHGGQSLSLLVLKRYARKYSNTKLAVDFHAEYYNSARYIFSKLILHRIIWRTIINVSLPYISSIYCISPSVAKMCNELYSIPKIRLQCLYLGTLPNCGLLQQRFEIRKRIRDELDISEDDLLLITGGKLNHDKRLDIIANSLKKLDNKLIHLIIFGKEDPGEEGFAERILREVPRVHIMGWCHPDRISRLYLASDLAVFPGGQSVLWQQAIETGLPALFRYWNGNDYLNIGNAVFLYSSNYMELVQWLNFFSLKDNRWILGIMRKKALELANDGLCYMRQAEKILRDNFQI